MLGSGKAFLTAAALQATVLALSLAQGTGADAQQPANGVGSQFELVFWQSVAASEDSEQLEAYLAQYPNGTFSALARAKIAGLQRRGGGLAATPGAAPPADPPSIEPVRAPTAPSPAAMPALVAPGAPEVAPAAAPATVPAAVSGVALPAIAPAQPAASDAPPATGGASLSDALHALSQSQGHRPPEPQAGPKAALPARPVLSDPPALQLPARFCTASARNSFYDAVYKPAKDMADSNNETAIAHLQRLNARYQQLSASNDIDAMNAVALEARGYQVIARGAYDASVAYQAVFARLMAVPVGGCP